VHVPRPIAALVALVLLVAACGGSGPSATPSTSTPPTQDTDPSASVEPVALTVGLGFIPSVQFAPFYLADQAGYYAEAGLDVEFQNKIDPDLITLVGQGSVDIGLADGTSVIPAVSQGIPIRYVAAIYGRFPSIVFAKASSGIDTPADLAGKRLGIPGRYGSSWIMLQALLDSAGLTPEDLEIVEYPDFGQGAAVIAGAVDASTGFVNNEPVQLELTGEPASILRVDDVVPLPGNGLIAGEDTLDAKSDAIAAFIAVTLRAMEEIEADPQVGLDAAFTAVPELAAAEDVQRAILEATIETWRGPVQEAGGLGATDPADWEASIAYLRELGLVPNEVTVDDVLFQGLLPAPE
jgi:NitT/TauT family transport system substrate-binding protein